MMMFSDIAQCLLVPQALGFFIIGLLFREARLPLSFKLALGYGLGMGLVAFWMLVLGMLGISYDLFVLAGPLLVLTLILAFGMWRSRDRFAAGKEDKGQGSARLSVLEVLCALFIFYQLAYIFWQGFQIPVISWDGFATVAFNAKVIYTERSLVYLNTMPHGGYPQNVPLMEAWVALNLGRWDNQLVKMIFPFFCLAFLGVHYHFLRAFTSRQWALVGCALLFSANFFVGFATISYRDFVLMYYNCATVMLLILGQRERRNFFVFLLLAGIFAGLGALTKTEGALYLIIFSALLAAVTWHVADKKTAWRSGLAFILPSFGLCLVYQLYRLARGIEMDVKAASLLFDWKQLLEIPIFIRNFFEEMFFSGDWNLVWLLFTVSLLRLFLVRMSAEVRVLFLALAGYFVVLFFLAFFTYSHPLLLDETWKFNVPRLILHFFPLVPALIVLLNWQGAGGRRSPG